MTNIGINIGGSGQTDMFIKMLMNSATTGMPANMGVAINMGMDGTQFSDGVHERGGHGHMPRFGGCQGNGGQVGFNNGHGMVPGFGGCHGSHGSQGCQDSQMKRMLKQMMQMLQQMMQQLQGNGMGNHGQCGGGHGQGHGPQGIGGPGNGHHQCPGMGQPPCRPHQNHGPNGPHGPGQNHGPHGPQGPGGPGQGKGQGQSIELQKGQTFTTPSGSTIDWKDDTVKVHEKGGGQRDLSNGFGMSESGPGHAKAMAWGNSSATAHTHAGNTSASITANSGNTRKPSKDQDWKVWGDPHIQNPDGSKQDFKTKNSVFTLQDGTKVLMCADKPDGNVNRVSITLPGDQMNTKGLDAKQTTVYGNDGDKFQSHGTLDNYLAAFQGAGLNQSPMGNQMFPMAA